MWHNASLQKKPELWEIFSEASTRAKGVILNLRIDTARELCSLTRKQLLENTNCGIKTANEIESYLALAGKYLSRSEPVPGCIDDPDIIIWKKSYYKRIK